MDEEQYPLRHEARAGQPYRTAAHHPRQAIGPGRRHPTLPGPGQAIILQTGNKHLPRHSLVVPGMKEGTGMLLDIHDTPADTGPDAPARAGRMMRLARAARTRWRVICLVTGAVLTLIGVVLGSGAVLLPGILLLLFALLHGVGSSGCTSADLLASWPWRG